MLGGEEFVDAFFGVVDHLVELGAGVGVVLGSGLGQKRRKSCKGNDRRRSTRDDN
jgi:hypothetical protein